MHVYEVMVYIVSVFALIIGLMLSSSGSTGGLAALSGKDLDLFKKTKDYGIIRVLRIVMLFLVFFLIIFSILYARNK